jgi:hypothetical protein
MSLARLAAALMLMLAITGPADAAPAQLRGKSITLSWTEQRVERNPATQQQRSVGTPFTFIVYVSTADRAFSRLTAGNTGSSDQGGGSKDAKAFATRVVNFAGQRMTASNTFIGGGARQIAVTFDAGFSGCTGNVIIGRSGSGPIKQKLMSGAVIELLSASVGSVSCSVSSGNALGGGL